VRRYAPHEEGVVSVVLSRRPCPEGDAGIRSGNTLRKMTRL
jgi:hypothetical protein